MGLGTERRIAPRLASVHGELGVGKRKLSRVVTVDAEGWFRRRLMTEDGDRLERMTSLQVI